jgi:hypothetical protein
VGHPHDYMGIEREMQETRMPPLRVAFVGAVASFLLEEGCHSAGVDTTIHVRHHLLLSLGWRFTCLPPNDASSITQLKSDVNRPI